MSRKFLYLSILTLLGLLVSLSGVAQGGLQPALAQDGLEAQAALGTAFTYQGKLTDGGNPANGLYDFQFKLFDAAAGGNQVGGAVERGDVSLSDGVFTASLDFGSDAFTGQARWLEIGVRPGSDNGGYTTLNPRQPLTAAPYALYAPKAPWSGLSGIPAGLADGVDNDTTYTAGSGLTLNGGQFSVNTTTIQARVTGTCANGSAIRVINTDGSVTCQAVSAGGASSWALTGNSGTNPSVNFVGTTDNQAFEVRVNNQRALRVEPTTNRPNLIGGYSGNSVTPGVSGATIAGGGGQNLENRVTDSLGTVGGGQKNQAGNGPNSTGDADHATVGGGFGNTASGKESIVAGGSVNTASGHQATVGGGSGNVASGTNVTISGGTGNTASYLYSTVGGGYGNSASGYSATVSGGSTNVASGYKATIPGGGENVAAGDYSFAAGNRAKIRSAHYGTFLFADKSTVNFNSAAPNEFAVRARGGVRFVLAINGSGSPTWSCNVVNGGSWSCSSDRNLKENFVELDTREVLKRLSGVPILQWNAKGVDPTIKHVGPMAQDFYAAFGLGDSDKVISTIDLDGVALASIQGLYEIAQAQDEQIAAQQEQIAALEARLATLEQAILGDAR